MKTLIKVTNDTIAVKSVSGLPAIASAPQSTLGLISQPQSQASSTRHIRKFHNAAKCYVCEAVTGVYGKHATGNCPKYTTASDRRNELTKAGKCAYCAKKPHLPDPCNILGQGVCKADKCVGRKKHYQAYCDNWEAELASLKKGRPQKK